MKGISEISRIFKLIPWHSSEPVMFPLMSLMLNRAERVILRGRCSHGMLKTILKNMDVNGDSIFMFYIL